MALDDLNGNKPTDGEREELHSLREHLDTTGETIMRDHQGACMACANFFYTAALVGMGKASGLDLQKAQSIAIIALERAGYSIWHDGVNTH
jgi:hypothetical protein